MGREGERDKHRSVPLVHARQGTEPTTRVRTPTGNLTCSLLDDAPTGRAKPGAVLTCIFEHVPFFWCQNTVQAPPGQSLLGVGGSRISQEPWSFGGGRSWGLRPGCWLTPCPRIWGPSGDSREPGTSANAVLLSHPPSLRPPPLCQLGPVRPWELHQPGKARGQADGVLSPETPSKGWRLVTGGGLSATYTQPCTSPCLVPWLLLGTGRAGRPPLSPRLLCLLVLVSACLVKLS